MSSLTDTAGGLLSQQIRRCVLMPHPDLLRKWRPSLVKIVALDSRAVDPPRRCLSRQAGSARGLAIVVRHIHFEGSRFDGVPACVLWRRLSLFLFLLDHNSLVGSASMASMMEAAADVSGNAQPGLIALCVVMLTFATVVVLLRCWTVYLSPTRKWGLDDFFALATLVCLAPPA